MKVDAVVLAGGEGAVIDPTVSIKGLVPDRRQAHGRVGRRRAARRGPSAEIAVVVPSAQNLGPWADKVDQLVISDANFIDNAIAGSEHVQQRTSRARRNGRPAGADAGGHRRLRRALAGDGAEFTYPLVRAEDMEAQFPGSQRTYVKVAGGSVTGGNMVLCTADLVRRNREIGQRLFDTRKSPVAMARVIGIPFVFKYVTGRLRVDDVERKMEQLLGGKCAAIYTSHASIGADVDKPIDVVVAERVLYSDQRVGIRSGAAERVLGDSVWRPGGRD